MVPYEFEDEDRTQTINSAKVVGTHILTPSNDPTYASHRVVLDYECGYTDGEGVFTPSMTGSLEVGAPDSGLALETVLTYMAEVVADGETRKDNIARGVYAMLVEAGIVTDQGNIT